jgi:hypothetical protein
LPDRQRRDDALLEPPVVEEMLSKLGPNHGIDCTSKRAPVCPNPSLTARRGAACSRRDPIHQRS